MKLHSIPLILLVFALCMPVASASRRKSPPKPPGDFKKVTRVDFEDEKEREKELEDEEDLYEEDEDDDDEEKDLKKQERDRIAAAREALLNEIRNRRVSNPKDYAKDAKEEGLSENDKRKSIHEVELVEPVVVRPVARRQR